MLLQGQGSIQGSILGLKAPFLFLQGYSRSFLGSKLQFLVLHFSYCALLYITDVPDDVICDIIMYADDTTLYSKFDQTFDLWQQLELASELESDLRDTVDWGRKWFVNFSAAKTQLVLFNQSNNTGAIDVKINGSVLEEKSSLKMLGQTFSSKLGWGSYISLDSFYEVSFSWGCSLSQQIDHIAMHGMLLSPMGWLL